jgi:hypothetical protein
MITIDDELQSIDKKQAVLAGSFLAMGLTAFMATSIPASISLVPAILSVPLLIMSLATHFHLKSNNGLALNGSFFQSSYKKKFQKWLTGYIDESQSHTETKYKIIFTSMWMRARKLNTHDVFEIQDTLLEKVANQMLHTKETSLDLFSLFLTDSKVSSMDFFEEDKDFHKKRAIAKKVYQDFENVGLVGKHFMYWSASEMLCLIPLQDYKLNSQDIKEIKFLTKRNLKTPKPFNHSLLFTELTINYCVKIINENIEHLPLLKEFFFSVGQDKKIEEISTLIEQTEKAAAISSHLSILLPEKKEVVKVKKI